MFIPNTRQSILNHDSLLGDVDEDIGDELSPNRKQRSFNIVPPHLLNSKKQLIEFSLNSSLAEKRAHLRARTEILKRTGFIETESAAVQKGWRTRGSSASESMFTHLTGTMEKCTKRAGALSMKFAPPEEIGN